MSRQTNRVKKVVRVRKPDVHVVALIKDDERYILMFDDARKGEALRTIGRWAGNPSLSFSWYDAAVLSRKIRA